MPVEELSKPNSRVKYMEPTPEVDDHQTLRDAAEAEKQARRARGVQSRGVLQDVCYRPSRRRR